jgi:hypothetical protein
LSIEKDGQAVKEESQLTEVIAEAVDKQLPIFARSALLVG